MTYKGQVLQWQKLTLVFMETKSGADSLKKWWFHYPRQFGITNELEGHGLDNRGMVFSTNQVINLTISQN